MTDLPEPWLRGTLTEIDATRRQVLHALHQAAEDIGRWCAPLTDAQLNARPCGLPSVAFQLRHIARSLDRLLTYMAGLPLTPEQHTQLASEMDPAATSTQVLTEFHRSLRHALDTIHRIDPRTYDDPRGVGRQQLPTTVGALMVHIAEHTQRHVGQAITTAKVVTASTP